MNNILNKTTLYSLFTGALFLLAFTSKAQYTPESAQSKAQKVVLPNQDQNVISPFFSDDGSKLWFTKLDEEPDGTKNQNVYSVDVRNGEWLNETKLSNTVNTEANELVIGASGNNLIYILRYQQNDAEQFTTLHAYKVNGDTLVKDHFLNIPPMDMMSQYFGFYVAPDESFIIVSMQGTYTFGMEDLYVLIRKGDEWSTPIHLGAQVNSASFEMSPFMTKDARYLFFSSNSHGAQGSADVFVSKRLSNTWTDWSAPQNLGALVNSKNFESHFTINEAGEKAVFVSNRDGGSGELYTVDFKRFEEDVFDKTNAHLAASGYLRMPKLPSMKVKLNLMDENDQVIQSVLTNEDGYFNIQSFLPDKNYRIAIDDSLKNGLEEAEIFLTNDVGDPMVFMNGAELGIFGFKVLSGDKIDEVSTLESLASKGKVVDKSTKISGRIAAYGTVNDKIKLNIIDEDQNVVQTIETDENGYFTFDTKAKEKSYFLSVEGDASGLVDVYEVYLTNDNLDQDIVVTKTDKHLFGFRALSNAKELKMTRIEELDTRIPEEILQKYQLKHNEENLNDGLSGYLKLDKLPLMDAELQLIDENDNVLGVSVTDADGKFSFTNEIFEGKYTLQLSEEQNKDLSNSEIFLAKNPTDVLFYINDGAEGVFAFRKLASDEPMTLYSLQSEVEQGKVVDENPTTLKGKFAYQKLPKKGVKLKLLDEKENIIQVTEVGADGAFKFENYTVNKNYFIAVEDGAGLSDIYEIYLSGEQKNVLVNRTNKYVYSFKVLPSKDVVLTENYVNDGALSFSKDATEPSEATADEGLVYLGDKQAYFEYDLNVLEKTKYVSLRTAADYASSGYGVIIRLSDEFLDQENGVQLQTIDLDQAKSAIKVLTSYGVDEQRISARMNGRDQIIIRIQ